jgi:hypothetical protein
VVVDQEPRPDALRRRLAELLRHPDVGRRARDADVDHPARSQLDHEEREHWAKEEVGELEEIARPGLAAVVAQEGRPPLAGGARWPHTAHVSLDGALADADPQLAQLAADALGAPQPVLARQPLDEIDGLLGDAGPPRPRGRSPAPDEPEAGAVPAQQRRRLDDQEGLAPRPDAARDQDQQRPIGPREAWSPRRARQDDQLLAQ